MSSTMCKDIPKEIIDRKTFTMIVYLVD
jgi:hypothetical protein